MFVCLKITQKPYYGTVGTEYLVKLSDYVVSRTLKASDNQQNCWIFSCKEWSLEICGVLYIIQSTHSCVWLMLALGGPRPRGQ